MKARVLLFSLLFIGFMQKVSSQHTFANWSKHFDGHEQNAFNNMLFDGQDIILNGYWFLSAEFEGITLPNYTSSNTLLMKMDLEGNVIWHTTLVGEGYESFFDMALDSKGDIVAVGWSSSNEPISINGEVVYVPDMEWTSRGVVAKFSGVDGSLMWYKPILPNEEYYNMSVNKIAIDENDNIYVSGYSNVSFQIDGIEFPYTQEGWGAQTFLAKLDPDGVAAWGEHFNFTQEGDAGWSIPKALIAIDTNVFLAFQYSKPILVNDTLLPYQGEGFYDWIALVKLSTETLEFTAVNAYGGSLDQNIAKLKLDGNGNLIAVGYFDSESDFNINGSRPMAYGQQDAYVAKFNDKLELKWLRSMGSEFATRAFNLDVTGENRIFIGGGFDSYTPFYFEGHKVIEMQSPNSLGMFQVIVDENGNFEKAFALYGNGIESRLDYRDAIVLDNDQVFAAGASSDYVEFTEDSMFYSIHDAGFIMKWDLSKEFYKIFFDVKDEGGASLNNAIVTLEGTSNPFNNHSFYQIDPGAYAYSVTLEGYDAVDGEVEVIDQDMVVPVTMVPINTSVNINNSIAISMFPNPANSILSINSDEAMEQVIITDAVGRTVHQQIVGTSSAQINIQGLPSGLYLVKIATKNGIATRKLQVIK
jgi:hypothetical protein